jgi:hypothetical protein
LKKYRAASPEVNEALVPNAAVFAGAAVLTLVNGEVNDVPTTAAALVANVNLLL